MTHVIALRFREIRNYCLLCFGLIATLASGQGGSHDDFIALTQADMGSGSDLPYRLFVPPDYDPAYEYPVMLWLHGWGERGTNNSSQLGGPFTAAIENFLSAENLVRHPCIVIAPQLASKEWWHYRAEVAAILDKTEQDYSVDTSRRYLTGLSWGGMGTWAYVTNWPEVWAAAVPICGHAYSGGGYGRLDDIPNMPIWAFHSADDGIVGVEGTDNAIMDHRKGGGNAHYTRYDSASHNAWTSAYNTPQLVEWVMSQRRDDSGTGVVHVDPLPYISIDSAVVGSTLRLEGRIREEGRGDGPEQDLQIDSVYWWSNEIDYEQRAWDGTVNGRTITSPSASFTQDDVGKRIMLGNNDLDKWNVYEITSVSDGNTVGVDEWLGNFSSVHWELHGPGSRYNPVPVDGLASWSADGIPLVAGTNRIHLVARAYSQSTFGGYAWLGGDSIEVELPDPTPGASSLELVLDAPAVPGALLFTDGATLALSGEVTAASGTVTLDWENNRGVAGSTTTTDTWTLPSIDLKKGYNRLRLSAVDATGTEVSHFLWVVRNEPPAAPDRQYLHAFPDSLQSIEIDGDFVDSDAWPAVRPYLAAVNEAANGTVEYADGSVAYSPNPGFSGLDRFTFEVSDGLQRSSGVVTISVGGSLSSETSLLDLTFDGAAAPSDVVAPAPSGTAYVDDISAEADGGTWSIANGALRLERPAIGGGDSGAGFRKQLPEADSLVIQFDLRVTGNYSSFWNELIVIGLGDFSGITEYDAWINGSRFADNLKIRGRGTNHMAFVQGGVNPVWEHAADGTTFEIIWLVNAAEAARSWQAPGGTLYTVDPHASTLLVNGTLVRGNLPRESGLSNDRLEELFVTVKGNAACTIELDDLSITAVGEAPESGLLAWRHTEGLAADGSEDAQAAGNGFPKLLNFAFGIDPEGSLQHRDLDLRSLPQVDFSANGELCLLARDAETNPGLIYEARWSPDLAEWNYLETLPTTEAVADGWVRLKWPIPEGEDRGFYKVDLVPLD